MKHPLGRLNDRGRTVQLNRNSVLVLSTALFGLTAGGSASAQDSPSSASPPELPPPGEIAQAPRAAGQSVQLEEIVVTAEKRRENLQKTPIAITAISSAVLDQEGIHDVMGLTQLVPNFSVSTDQPDMQIVIRGVASLSDGPPNDPAVAFTVDGVYLSRATGAGGTFYDLDHVEVLRGPQGTLYGRNADAGAVNVVPKEPTDRYEAEGAIETGNYALLSTYGMLNLPMDDKIDLRASFASFKHDGYIVGGFDDADNVSGRVQLLAKPMDNMKIRFYGDYFHQGGAGAADVAAPFLNPNNHWDNTIGLLAQTPAGMANLLIPYPPNSGRTDDTVWNVHAQLDWDLGFGTLTYIPAFVVNNIVWAPIYGLGIQGNVARVSHETTHEVRLTSDADARKAGDLKWTAGLYWFRENQTDHTVATFANPIDASLAYANVLIDGLIHTSSYAGFGQATYAVLDEFRLTAGARYTWDSKDISGINLTTIPGAPASPMEPYSGSDIWRNFGWRTGAEWDITPDSMAFATVATGYKAGGFRETPGNNSYNPEKLTDYELGVKNRLLSKRLQLNLAAFYYDYSNYQAYDIVGTFQEAFSVGASTLYGLELESNYLITDHDRIDLSTSYEQGAFGKFVFPLSGTDLTGKTFPLLARWNITAGYEHTWGLGNAGTIMAHIQTHFSSSYPTTLDQLSGSTQPEYTNTELNATYTPTSGRWSLQAYVKNLENRAVFTAGNDGSAGPGLVVVGENLSDPRTFGVRLSARY
jgi:iron complex outermembrane recepter protein